METSIHNVTAISVSDTVHENDEHREKFTYTVKAFSKGTTPAKLSI